MNHTCESGNLAPENVRTRFSSSMSASSACRMGAMYFNYTTRSLWRGGQRTLLAIFCVAVGVMAIVALPLVGIMITNAFTSNVGDANGGGAALQLHKPPLTPGGPLSFHQLQSNSPTKHSTT